MRSLAHLIRSQCAWNAEFPVLAFVDVSDGAGLSLESRSYGNLWKNGQRLAAGLAAENMSPGETFALIMRNHAAFADLMVAASVEGAVFVPIDPRLTGAALRYMLQFAECRGAVVADYSLDQLVDVIPDLPGLEWIWVLESEFGSDLPVIPGRRVRRLSEVPAGVGDTERPLRSRDPAGPMQMLYTSGTTGNPKAILSPFVRFASVATLGETIGIRPDDRLYTGLSLTHSNAQFLTLGTALHGRLPAVISRCFTRSKLWDICREFGCTIFNLLGGMATALMAVEPRDDDANHPVRQVLSAGMPRSIWEDFRHRFSVEIFEFYGTAEGGMLLNPPGKGPIGSIGKPPPGLIAEILDDRQRACPAGVPGEICFRDTDGNALPVAYFRNPAASVAKTSGGWFRSGDVGHRDAQDWFYFDYRMGGALRKNGEFIDPFTIEKVIADVSGIHDVHVFGVETKETAPGEKLVVAAVEVSGDTRPRAIFDLCHIELPGNHVPDYLMFVDAIPKTASEKPQDRFLVDLFQSQPERVVPRVEARE